VRETLEKNFPFFSLELGPVWSPNLLVNKCTVLHWSYMDHSSGGGCGDTPTVDGSSNRTSLPRFYDVFPMLLQYIQTKSIFLLNFGLKQFLFWLPL
jgi:hypothetical protein